MLPQPCRQYILAITAGDRIQRHRFRQSRDGALRNIDERFPMFGLQQFVKLARAGLEIIHDLP
jgi:hypothetical protein